MVVGYCRFKLLHNKKIHSNNKNQSYLEVFKQCSRTIGIANRIVFLDFICAPLHNSIVNDYIYILLAVLQSTFI